MAKRTWKWQLAAIQKLIPDAQVVRDDEGYRVDAAAKIGGYTAAERFDDPFTEIDSTADSPGEAVIKWYDAVSCSDPTLYVAYKGKKFMPDPIRGEWRELSDEDAECLLDTRKSFRAIQQSEAVKPQHRAVNIDSFEDYEDPSELEKKEDKPEPQKDSVLVDHIKFGAKALGLAFLIGFGRAWWSSDTRERR